MFIDQNFAKNFEIQNLDEQMKAYNVDGTENKKGLIKSYVDLENKRSSLVFLGYINTTQ